MTTQEYRTRIVEGELDSLLAELPALALEGPKAVGKTATAERRAQTIFRLDESAQAALAQADPQAVTNAPPPVLIDEWQHVPAVWDSVRRAVDRDRTPNRYILAGSAAPTRPPTHSGAGRIVRIRMRPLSLAERGLITPTVSLTALLTGGRPPIEGQSSLSLAEYTREIVASGFPGMRPLSARALRAQLDGYISRIVDRDFDEQGHAVRRPETLRRWLRAYAAATATTTSYEKIRNAATGGDDVAPARATADVYREVLEQLWMIDDVPGWVPSRNRFARLIQAPRHHLADPALAVRLLEMDEGALLHGNTDVFTPRDGTLLGQLFESLVTLCMRVYAQAAEAKVHHLRVRDGRQEVDLIVERLDQRVLAFEVKLGATVADDDVRHLVWLREKLGDELIDAAVITTGPHAFRRPDGIGVIPAALLGP